MVSRGITYRSIQAGVLAGSLLLASGCKTSPQSATDTVASPAAASSPRNDQDIAKDIQGRIQGESALAGQNIQVSVNGGMATLSGAVNNDAARALAGVDSGSVNGVRTVINNLTVTPQQAAQTAPPPVPASAPERRHRRDTPPPPQRQRLAERASNDRAVAPVQPPIQSEPVRTVPPVPAAPPPPVAKTVSIASGTSLPVRLTEGLDSATAQQGQVIHGTLASDIITENMLAIPRGTPVTGRVVDAKDATHFSGSALLSIELTQIALNNRQLSVVTSPYSEQGKGRGKNTAEKAGGGAALGAIIGALAGGGKGAAIGAATGGGVGAGVNGVTRGQQVKIPAETLINFKLQSPVSVTTSRTANGQPRTFDENSGDTQPQ